jgi:hypothetical protein
MAALNDGPVAVAVRADVEAFKLYKGGIIPGRTCRSAAADVNHVVLAVGYGSLNGIAYWKIKNSWGSQWGQNGFALLARSSNEDTGVCGIYSSVTYQMSVSL